MGKTWDKIWGRREIVLYIIASTGALAFLLGKLSQENFMEISTMVIGFYFLQRSNASKTK